MSNIYERIRKLRENKGMTQDELAIKLGYTSRSSIAKIESGKTDISQSKVRELAEIFNTTTSYLMDGTGNSINDNSNIEMNNLEIGNRIKTEREHLNLTLKDIADDIGVAISTIQRYENGLIKEIKLPFIKAIANSLNVNPNWLVGKDTIKHTNNNNIISNEENKLLSCFRELNTLGKDEALKRIGELVQIPKYKTVQISIKENNIKELPKQETQ